MDENGRVIVLKEIVEATIKALGMHAENMKRQSVGASMAYDAHDFFQLVDVMNAVFEVHRG